MQLHPNDPGPLEEVVSCLVPVLDVSLVILGLAIHCPADFVCVPIEALVLLPEFVDGRLVDVRMVRRKCCRMLLLVLCLEGFLFDLFAFRVFAVKEAPTLAREGRGQLACRSRGLLQELRSEVLLDVETLDQLPRQHHGHQVWLGVNIL